ncbi:MAG: ABC transporter substrate-binding protein [Burkholderiaceae bacterium]|jgi:branched-chain amino acid transport system substrate-binding protein|nr:ABC transporter substrate-binding protein [Burkholderiaceae bacterium]
MQDNLGRTRRRALLAAAAASATGVVLPRAQAQGAAKKATGRPIRIGEINSYSTIPQFLVPYRKAWELALEEINAAGGLLGRPVEVVARDDAGKPDDAIRHATELVTSERVDLLAGTFLSNVGLAVADFALRSKVLFMASEPLTDALVWDKGNRYTFRLRASTYMQSAMLVAEAAKLPAKRWVTIAPNYEYGQSAVASFKALLKAARPDVEFVAEQWPALNKLEAGSTLQAVLAARPEAIFNVTFGADLARLVREGNLRGLFPRLPVVSLLSGEPEYLDVLREETPANWTVTGYPWDQIATPEHAKFFNAYFKKNNDYPRLGSVVGYAMMQAIAAAIARAKSTDTEKMITAFRGLSFTSPFGPVTFRAIDHQSTMGAYVGKLALRDGRGTMVDWRYADGAMYLPPDDEVRKRRPADAMR